MAATEIEFEIPSFLASLDDLTYTYQSTETETVTLDSNWPVGAEIVVDGVTYTEDTDIELEAGDYTATPNTVAGYTNEGVQNFTVVIGVPQTVTLNYTPVITGDISLTANWPTNATVTIDGQEYTENSVIVLAAGTYPCVPNAVEGYTTPASQDAIVTLGGTTNISFLWVLVVPGDPPTCGGRALDEIGIWNMAIGLVGGNKVLNSSDLSLEAEQCCLYYDLARKFCLENRDWTFAATSRMLARLASPVGTEFSYSFTLPSDCLVVRKASAEADLLDDIIHQLNGNTLVTDSAVAYIRYTKNVVDTSLFSPSFKAAVSHKLAEYISPTITGDKALKRTLMIESEELIEGGGAINGMQGTPRKARASRLVNARFRSGYRYGLGSKL